MPKKTFILPIGRAVLTLGCQMADRRTTPIDRPPTFHEDIICISMMVHTPLLDEDGDKIADGVAVKVYLNRPNQTDFVAGKGSLVLHMYKTIKTSAGKIQNQSLRTWTVSEEDFARAIVRQGFGLVCHQIAVYWGNQIPQGPGVYLQAEFIRTDQKRVWSRAISLPVPESPRSRR